jgi:hypothetical protein
MNLIQLLTDQRSKGLLTASGEHHEIGDGGWLVMMNTEDSPLRSPERAPDLASR